MNSRNYVKEELSESGLSTSNENPQKEKKYKKSKKIKKVKKRKYKKRKNDIIDLMLSKSRRYQGQNKINFNYTFGMKYEKIDKLMNKSGNSLKVKSSCPEFQLFGKLKKKEKNDKICDSVLNFKMRRKNHKFLQNVFEQ